MARDFGSGSAASSGDNPADAVVTDPALVERQTHVELGIKRMVLDQGKDVDDKLGAVVSARRTIGALIGDHHLERNAGVVAEDHRIGDLIVDVDIAKGHALALMTESGSDTLGNPAAQKRFAEKRDFLAANFERLFNPAGESESVPRPENLIAYGHLQAAAQAAERDGSLTSAEVGNITQAIVTFRARLEEARDAVGTIYDTASGVAKRFDEVGLTASDRAAIAAVVGRGRDMEQRSLGRREAAAMSVDDARGVTPADVIGPLSDHQVARGTSSWIDNVRAELKDPTGAAFVTANQIGRLAEGSGFGRDRGVVESISGVQRVLQNMPRSVEKLQAVVGYVVDGHRSSAGLTEEQRGIALRQLGDITKGMTHDIGSGAAEAIVGAVRTAESGEMSLDARIESRVSPQVAQMAQVAKRLDADLARIRQLVEVETNRLGALIDGHPKALEEFEKRARTQN